MYVIESNKLVHVDSTKDVLEYFGVKGMKWGQRRQEKLYNRYIQKGYTKKAAAEKANKRRKIEKELAIATGVAGTALVAYGASKYLMNKNAGNKLVKTAKKAAEQYSEVKKPKVDLIKNVAKDKVYKNGIDEVIANVDVSQKPKKFAAIRRAVRNYKDKRAAKKLARISKNNAAIRKAGEKFANNIDRYNSKLRGIIDRIA